MGACVSTTNDYDLVHEETSAKLQQSIHALSVDELREYLVHGFIFSECQMEHHKIEYAIIDLCIEFVPNLFEKIEYIFVEINEKPMKYKAKLFATPIFNAANINLTMQDFIHQISVYGGQHPQIDFDGLLAFALNKDDDPTLYDMGSFSKLILFQNKKKGYNFAHKDDLKEVEKSPFNDRHPIYIYNSYNSNIKHRNFITVLMGGRLDYNVGFPLIIPYKFRTDTYKKSKLYKIVIDLLSSFTLENANKSIKDYIEADEMMIQYYLKGCDEDDDFWELAKNDNSTLVLSQIHHIFPVWQSWPKSDFGLAYWNVLNCERDEKSAANQEYIEIEYKIQDECFKGRVDSRMDEQQFKMYVMQKHPELEKTVKSLVDLKINEDTGYISPLLGSRLITKCLKGGPISVTYDDSSYSH